MAVVASEMKLKKSYTVMNGGTNGGVLGTSIITSGVRHGIFPRVSRSERTLGVTRHRKVFLMNENNSQEIANGALVYLNFPSTAGDRFYLALGTQTDIETNILATPPDWTGCGKLNANVTAGATSIQVLMENSDFVFPANSILHISSNYKTAQTAAAGVTPGASVAYSGGVWGLSAHNGNTMYPNGIWMDNNVVVTEDGTGHEEWLQVAAVAPYSYAGNVVTIQLASPVVDSYTTIDTWVGGCVGNTDVVATTSTYSKSSTGGSYNDVGFPVVPYNRGCIEDTITITFTGSGSYSASGSNAGALGSGTVSSAFSPVNPLTSSAYFTIPVGFFTGSWIAADTLTFKTHPSAIPIWLKEVVPAGTLQNANNAFGLGYYWE